MRLHLLRLELLHGDGLDLLRVAFAVGVRGGDVHGDGLALLAVAAHVRFQAGDDLAGTQGDGQRLVAALLAVDVVRFGDGLLAGLDHLAVDVEGVVEANDVAVLESHGGADRKPLF